MLDFFYNLPIWLITVGVLGFSLLVGLGTSYGVRHVFQLHSSDDETESAVSLMQVVAAYIGILIAFAGVQVWQDFADADNGVHREAATAAQLYRDMATYGPETVEARARLRGYTASIVKDEWPLLAKGQTSDTTDVALFRLFESIGKIRPKDGRDTAIYNELFHNLNELVELRRDRLIHSDSGMPVILWIVGLVGSILIVAYTATFPRSRTNALMIGGISIALGLVFLFILIVDRPFMGSFSVSNAELAGLSQKFDTLDRLSRAATPQAAISAPR
jgi:hypothetical protein